MFLSTARLVSVIAVLTLGLNVSAQASDGARLTTVAAENGFSYQWIPTEAGATLTRPGVRIVIRAGQLFYDVNNATPIADSAPRFDGRDLLISKRLAEHLRELARKYPYPQSQDVGGSLPDKSPMQANSNAGSGLLTLIARPIPGREALTLSGTGPANVPLTVTLSGELSTDLPVVVLSRKSVRTAADGTFFAEMDYGQDTHARTALIVTVAALSGAPSTQARATISVPSPQIHSSRLDDWPKK